MSKRFRGREVAWSVALVAALVVWGADSMLARGERQIRMRVECHGEACSATPLTPADAPTISTPSTAPGTRTGLYAYTPHEFGGQQLIRALLWRGAAGLGREYRFDEPEGVAHLEGDEHWSVVRGRGVSYTAAAGNRGMALLAGMETRDFTLDLDLLAPLDAGVLVRAGDDRSGMLLVVRQRYNDFFFCRLEGGEPGPVLALAALTDLSVRREGLRLAALVAEIALPALLLMLLFEVWIGRQARHLPEPPAAARAPSPGLTRRGLVLLVLLFVLTTVLQSAIGLMALGGVPHVADETAYLFQSRLLAAGHAWAPAPDWPEFFQHEHIFMEGGRWFAKYPLLFPLLLSIGWRAGVPWLINPLLGACTGLVIFALGRELAGWWGGLLAWFLLLSSPFFLIMGGTYMSHMTAALLASLSFWLALRAGKPGGHTLTALPAGVCLGLAFLARPYTALLAGVVIGGWMLAGLAAPGRPRRRLLAGVGLLLLGALPLAAVLPVWNQTLAPGAANLYTAYDGSDTLGFGPEKGNGWLKTWGTWGHTPAKALRSMHQYLDYTSRYLLGWPGRLSLALPLAGFFLWPGRGRWLLAALPLALAAGHALYWATQHVGYGARYWFSGAPALILLAMLGARRLAAAGPGPRRLITVALAAMMAWNLVFYLPHKLAELPAYGGITADLPPALHQARVSRGIIFVRTEGLQYNDGFHLHDPFAASELIFARDLGGHNAVLQAAHPRLPAYRWDGHRLFPLPQAADPRPQAAELP